MVFFEVINFAHHVFFFSQLLLKMSISCLYDDTTHMMTRLQRRSILIPMTWASSSHILRFSGRIWTNDLSTYMISFYLHLFGFRLLIVVVWMLNDVVSAFCQRWNFDQGQRTGCILSAILGWVVLSILSYNFLFVFSWADLRLVILLVFRLMKNTDFHIYRLSARIMMTSSSVLNCESCMMRCVSVFPPRPHSFCGL